MDANDSPRIAPLRKPLLPDTIKKPLLLLWISVLPQLVLLLVNLRAFWIASGECAPWQKNMAGRISAFELGLILGVGALALLFHARRKFIPWSLNWVLLIAPILYLWLFTWQIGNTLIPASVSTWILPPEQLLYYQFTLMMPVIFYATVRLACIDIQISIAREVGVVALALFGPPLFWLLFTRYARFIHCGDNQVLGVVIAVTFLCSSVIVVAGVTRACVGGYLAIRRKGAVALGILSFLVGLAGPIGGLWLNSRIPFPADFQGWPVYALALVNGCLLLLPDFNNPRLRRFVWLAQCALFPFTFYFFFVFLPFLPLFIPAIIIMGAGFLVLTPTALFLVHGQRILDGYGFESREGKRFIPALLAALALAILPAITITQAVIDRTVLRHAMDYIYSPDYRLADRFSGSRSAVQRSLERLRDFKAGAYQPFLSDFYNWAVFDNLVLPDDKMSEMARAFFGHDLASAKTDRVTIFGDNAQRTRPMRESRRAAEPPSSNIALTNLTANSVSEGDCERTTLTLDMRNNGASQGEFVTNIHIPDGVFVSGFWLKIGKERMAGRLFEKKTALWVYQKIRDERSNRDPGILVYSAPNSIELRIFPFAAHEERQVEIEFFYPTALQPAITIGERQWRREPAVSGICLTLTSDGASAVLLSPKTAEQLPQTQRLPYLHFIVDRSAASMLKDEEIVSAIRKTAAQFNGVKECVVTLANYESADVLGRPVPIESINAGMFRGKSALTQRGGFLAERAIKRALLSYHDRLARAEGEDAELQRYPIIIVLGDLQHELLASNELYVFGRFTPDADGFYVTKNGEQLASQSFSGKRDSAITQKPHPVALLKVGDAVSPCALDAAETQVVPFEATTEQRALSVLDHGAFRALDPVTTIPPESRYSSGMQAWQRYLAWVTNPSLGNSGLGEVVALSRETGILLAATSYIVVENSAQWKILALKQHQKLGNQAALEFEETPEPTTWLLILFGAATLYFFNRRSSLIFHKL